MTSDHYSGRSYSHGPNKTVAETIHRLLAVVSFEAFYNTRSTMVIMTSYHKNRKHPHHVLKLAARGPTLQESQYSFD